MAEVTIKNFADQIRIPPERLIEQLEAAGVKAQSIDDTLSDDDKDGVINVEEYRARLIAIFVALDKDGDGYLVEAEVPDGHKDVFIVADADGNGRLGLREYLVFMMPRFWKADYDGDNVLSLPEVIAADKREAAA